VQEIDSGDGIRSTISGFAVFANEDSKEDRLAFDVYAAAGINCIVQPSDALQGRINGFIREHRFLR
jgi:hypothetical protein